MAILLPPISNVTSVYTAVQGQLWNASSNDPKRTFQCLAGVANLPNSRNYVLSGELMVYDETDNKSGQKIRSISSYDPLNWASLSGRLAGFIVYDNVRVYFTTDPQNKNYNAGRGSTGISVVSLTNKATMWMDALPTVDKIGMPVKYDPDGSVRVIPWVSGTDSPALAIGTIREIADDTSGLVAVMLQQPALA